MMILMISIVEKERFMLYSCFPFWLKFLFAHSQAVFCRKKEVLSFLSGLAALLILHGFIPSSRHRARIPQFSVATGRCGCEYKCFRKKRLRDANRTLTMASFSFCQMVSGVFEYTCSAGREAGWTAEPWPRVTWGQAGRGLGAEKSLRRLGSSWLLKPHCARLGIDTEVCSSKLQSLFLQNHDSICWG